jgi:uncharacterized protein with gpF-like domain
MTPLQEKRAKARRQRERFQASHRVERHFASQLLSIAANIQEIITRIDPTGDISKIPEMEAALNRYAEILGPWSVAASSKLIARISQQNEASWRELGNEIGVALAKEIAFAPTGELMRQLLAEQVTLITSLPREAAERIHEYTLEAITTSTRAKEISELILKSGEVAASRARCIARTEVSRTSSLLTQARATYIGGEGYIWHTAGDEDVRNKPDAAGVSNPVGSHRLLDGKFIAWGNPPIASTTGERAHAGCIYNCRCWIEPIIPRALR